MPVMDGIEALKQIRSTDNNAKVIMVSALGQELKIAEAISNAASHYIIKPFKEDDIIKKVESILNLN